MLVGTPNLPRQNHVVASVPLVATFVKSECCKRIQTSEPGP
jgi:hypothetical protein